MGKGGFFSVLLKVRDFEPRDVKGFATLVAHIFKDDHYTSNPFLNSCLMRYELLGYLKHQNYAKVVCGKADPEGADQPIGIFIAKIGEAPLLNWAVLWSFLYSLPLLLFKPGRRYLTYVRGLRDTDKRLLTGKRFDAELKLFVVRAEYQNEGIGHRLLTGFQEVCRQRGVKEYFLFTDSYCNVEYYLERGFLLEAERTYNFFHETPPAQYYLFTHMI